MWLRKTNFFVQNKSDNDDDNNNNNNNNNNDFSLLVHQILHQWETFDLESRRYIQ